MLGPVTSLLPPVRPIGVTFARTSTGASWPSPTSVSAGRSRSSRASTFQVSWWSSSPTTSAQSTILDGTIAPVLALLELFDQGVTVIDPVVRLARAQLSNPQFSRLTGLSGGPVFNLTAGRLAGIVVRGGMQGAFATMRYLASPTSPRS